MKALQGTDVSSASASPVPILRPGTEESLPLILLPKRGTSAVRVTLYARFGTQGLWN